MTVSVGEGLMVAAEFGVAFYLMYQVGVTRGRELARAERDADVDRLLGISDPDPMEGLVDYRPTFTSGQVARWERWLARWER